MSQDQQGFSYRSDNVNSSIGALVIRLLVGVPIALVAGFAGNVVNGIVVPSPAAGDDVAFLVRMAVLGFAASTGGMIACFNSLESKLGAFLIWFISGIGGMLGAVSAYFIGDGYIDHPDVYILGQQLTQVVLFGGALVSNIAAGIISLASTRLQR